MQTVPLILNNNTTVAPIAQFLTSENTRSSFIEANTISSTVDEIRNSHVIPVFIKDNEPAVSHYDFISAMQSATHEVFGSEQILSPEVRLSHPIKGRIPEARNKPAKDLLEHEKTLYYERMAFTIEIASITEQVSGNQLKLTVGGVKSYHLDNLYNKKGVGEHFKAFIGFQNTVCTNLCVWTDGFQSDMRVNSPEQLRLAIMELFHRYDINHHVNFLHSLDQYELTEKQFAQLIGRCKLYQHLNAQQKNGLPELQFGESQLSAIARDYYKDQSFCRSESGNINLWRLYNLFTGANKSSYIDTFLDRNCNATEFVGHIKSALVQGHYNWFLS
jgi:hypothetical protein